MSIKWDEDGVNPDSSLQQKVETKWKAFGWYSGTEWPKLSDVRGKAILLRWFDQDDGKDTFGINFKRVGEDEYHHNPPGKWDQQDNGKSNRLSYNERWRLAWNHLTFARNGDINDMVVHFTGLADTAWDGSPADYASEENPRVMRHLSETENDINPTKQRFGVIIHDFLHFQHSVKIISKHWQQRVYTPGSLQFAASDAAPVHQFENGIRFMFQKDCNLVVYDKDNNVKWATTTTQSGQSESRSLHFQEDGNLVIYDNNRPIWASVTDRHNDCKLRFLSGPPYIMIDTNKEDGQILWTTVDSSMLH